MPRKILVTKDNFERIIQYLDKFDHWVSDTETTGLYTWHGARQCGIATTPIKPKADAFYFPFRHELGNNLNSRHLARLIKSMGSRKQTGFNWKFDIHMLREDGLVLPPLGMAEDVMLAAHLINENEESFKLKNLAAKYIDPHAKDDESQLTDRLVELGYGKGDMWRLDSKEVKNYAASDVIYTRELRELYTEPLHDWGLFHLWLQVNDYMLATVDMESRGLLLDVPLIKKYMDEAEVMAEKTLKKIQRRAGYPLNPGSPKQVCAFLGVESSAKDILEAIENPPPEIRMILDYRGWSKVNNSYYRPYLEKMDSDGVLHPNIKLHGTISGRPSAEDPNTQAVPRTGNKVYKVKDVFVARPGYTLVSLDYSQAELRLGAYLIQERAMIRILESGRDIHQSSADEMGIDRDSAKRINFGSFYGIGPDKLSRTLRIPFEEAQRRLAAYHNTFKRIKVAYHELQAKARHHGYIRLWTGRVRHYNVPWAEPHKALSNVVQGGVAEMMRVAIQKIDRERRGGKLDGVHMLLQVHDQILFEMPDEQVKEQLPIAKSLMEDFPQFRPLMKVDAKLGKRWGSLTD